MSSASLIAGDHAKSAAIRLLRRAVSFPVVLGAFLVALAVFTVRGRFDDPDMWWHLRNGEVIWTTHVIPITDRFSYTAYGHAYVPYEWLSQALIYGFFKAGGYSGLMTWLCFFSAAVLVAGYVLCSLYSGNAKVGFVGAMVVWFFSTVGLAVRPQVIGYFLLIVELLLLHLGRTRNPRWLVGLPFLFALWVNCHASFFLGLVVLGVFLFCSFIEFQKGALCSPGWGSGRRHLLTIVTVVSTGAVFLNPMGAKQVFYPVDTMLRLPMSLSNVQEWYPLVISDPRGIGLLMVVTLIAVCLIVQRSSKLFLDELLLLLMGAWLALSHQRMVFAFGILAAPTISRLLSPFWESYNASKDRPVTNAVCILLGLAVAFLAFPSSQNLAKQVENGSPVQAVNYIKTHQLSGNMLNSYVYGGYLVWALPEHPDFIDGRADLFEWAGVTAQFGSWAMLESDPNVLLNEYHVMFCLLGRGEPMAHVMPLLRNWKEVYSDNSSVIFVRSDKENSAAN